MSQELSENPTIKNWIRLKRSPVTRKGYLTRIKAILDYFDLTPEELTEMDPKEARDLCILYQNENRSKLGNNTILTRQTAVASLFEHLDKPIKWKRQSRVKQQADVTSHVFSNGDLARMFQVARTRDKAILSLAASLSWEISGFIAFRRKTLRSLLERQEQTGETFVYFRQIREKTGQPRLGILNPLAIKWCRKWLQEWKPNKYKKKSGSLKRSDIFDLTSRGVFYRLEVLAGRANIKLTGSVRFHNIRKWVMSGLSRCGFNEFQIKFILGKAIPISDGTYLQTLEDEIRERYPEAYDNYLNLTTTPSKAGEKKIEKENKRLKEKFAEMELENEKTKEEMKDLSKTVKSLIDKLENLTEK